jgi:energy-coupling factor transporter transmembrane protein EcfT
MCLRKREQYPILLFFVAEIILILFVQPQFRYILPAFFYPFASVLSKIKLSGRFLSFLVYFSFLPVFVPIFFHLNYEKLLENSALLKPDSFQTKNLIIPEGISKYKNLTFKKVRLTNFDYYNPQDESRFLSLQGNGPVPCVKTDYLYYIYVHSRHVPALIGDDFSDGFCSIRMDPDSIK